jgi:hypothetical protein
MPFTPSHAIVALPFVVTPIAPAAVAVGAMAPDLPLFVRGTPLTYAMTHSYGWMPVTVVVALVLLLVWRMVLRPAATELSPDWLARRLPPRWRSGAGDGWRETFALRTDPARPSGWGVVLLLVGLAIGVASHILWDSFSHEGRTGVTWLPVLDAAWGPLLGYKWVQYGSGAIGLVVLAVAAVLWLRRAAAADPVARVLPAWVRWAWWLSLPVVAAVAVLVGYMILGPFTSTFGPVHLAYRALPPACAVWGALTAVLAVVVQAMRGRAR